MKISYVCAQPYVCVMNVRKTVKRPPEAGSVSKRTPAPALRKAQRTAGTALRIQRSVRLEKISLSAVSFLRVSYGYRTSLWLVQHAKHNAARSGFLLP